MSARLAHPLWRINESAYVPLIYISILMIARNVLSVLYYPLSSATTRGGQCVIPRTRNKFF